MSAATPEELHELISHLLHSGGSLWVPGALPHVRNWPVRFIPPELPMICMGSGHL